MVGRTRLKSKQPYNMAKIFTLKEVAQHSIKSDIWMVIEGNLIDGY